MIKIIKNNVKNEKAITMTTLVITVLLLIIITGVLTTNSYNSIQISKLTKLDNDITALNDRIAAYYVEHEELPIYGNVYKKTELQSVISDLSGNDGEDYYTIDLSKLDNITLNYGEDYLTLSENSYIINVESHVIYYLKGVTYKGVVYHTVGKNPTVSLDI